MIAWVAFAVLAPQRGDDAATRIAALIFSLAGVGVVVALFALAKALARKRTQAFQNAATMIGFTFGGDEWPDKLRAPLLETALFIRGHGHLLRNILVGSASGFRASLFDYTFVQGRGRDSQRYTQTVAAFSKDGAAVPYFELRPANLLSRAWDVVAHKDIHFDANPEFARRYVLRGALPEKVRELFTPGLISFGEGLEARAIWHIEGADDTIVVYRLAKKVAPEKLRDFLDQTSAIASAFFSFAGSSQPASVSN